MARGSEGNRERGRPGVNALFSSNPQEEGGGDQENHLANVFSLAANEEEDWKEHQAVRTEEGFKSGVNQGLTPAAAELEAGRLHLVQPSLESFPIVLENASVAFTEAQANNKKYSLLFDLLSSKTDNWKTIQEPSEVHMKGQKLCIYLLIYFYIGALYVVLTTLKLDM